MSKHVIEDAKRCLQCKTPRCQKGCPANTQIREFIHLLLHSKIEEAGKMLYENNPLSLVCSYVCPQENQCEGHCVLGAKGSPVQISAIEKYISDYYLNIYHPKPSTRENGKVAIIGSGPAGITIATILSRHHYDVTIFEGNDQIGGVMRYGIPEFRLPKVVLDRMMDVLVKSGVRIRPNTAIGTNLNVDDLFRDGYRSVFIGTGVWRPSRLNIQGESLGNVHYAIEYLRNPGVYRLGKRLAVIGVGNVAMDVARTAFRHGCEEVWIIGNLEEEDITARSVELEFAKIDGAKLMLKKSTVAFVDGGVMLADSLIKTDENGRRRAEPMKGTEQLLPVDSSIIAVGQGPRAVIVSSTSGIEVAKSGLVAVDELGRTTRKGVFAAGDVVTGAKTVVGAMQISKQVAEAMHRYMESGDWPA
ncbi:MAG: NAD(P)-dependent oxidoreductase [Clostridiales bacterium]|nr:NAD(P)-dependent oxidoreductase [Clostridiales bacterium]